MIDERTSYPPWTDDQVDSINGFQESNAWHPFTCLHSHPGRDRRLRANHECLYCPECDYIQHWCHRFMADGSWEQVEGTVGKARDAAKKEGLIDEDN